MAPGAGPTGKGRQRQQAQHQDREKQQQQQQEQQQVHNTLPLQPRSSVQLAEDSPLKNGSQHESIRPPLIATDHLQTNMKAVMYGRSFMTIVAGVVAGVLGLTGLLGFVCYFAAMGCCSLTFLLKTGLQPRLYVDSASRLTTDGLLGGLLSFVLFWTLAYDIVHIF